MAWMNENPEPKKIQQAIRDKYQKVAQSAEGWFKYVTGREGAVSLGYDPKLMEGIPSALMKSFCGVGNPFAIGTIHPGDWVLDVGCGAGFDVYIASQIVGEGGRVFGLDLTPEMVAAARGFLDRLGLSQAEIRQGNSEELPFEDRSMDVVISNGVFNLSPNKARTFEEVARVLKPGGRLQFADIVLQDGLPGEIVGSLEAWSN